MMRRRALTAGLARLTFATLLTIGLWSLAPAAGWAQAALVAEQAPPKAAWPATGNSAQRQAVRPQSWLLDTQRTLQSRLAAAVREMKKGNGWLGALTLIGLSFLYGLFHAVGPGHGKAVISSYVVANRTTVRRGMILSFAASAAQAFSAIGLVAVLAIGMNAAGLQIRQTVAQFEIASAVLVILTGLWLLFTQLRRQLTAFRPEMATAHLHQATVPAQHDPAEHHVHHHHDHAHGEDCGCGHAHMPLPRDFEGRWSLRHAAAVVFAVGIRPCTGAILILVFALTQGMFWAGVMATFAMALGTAIMVSALAILAVGSREAAARFAGSHWADRIYGAAGTLGAVLIVLFGSALLYGAIYFPAPF